MNKSQVYLNKMLAMLMLAYAISLLVGEAIRDVQYAQVIPHELNLLAVPSVNQRSRWFLYSGPFLLLKQRYRLHQRVLRQIVRAALLIFTQLVFANVRSVLKIVYAAMGAKVSRLTL